MFVLLSRYLKPLDEVDFVVPEHRRYLDRFYDSGLFIVSGPQSPRVGGVIVAGDGSREDIEKILAEDPFVREGIAEYQIIEFEGTKCAKGFLAMLEANAPS